MKCGDAINYLYSIDERMYLDVLKDENLQYPGFSCILNCEEALLSLASSGEVDGILYSNFLKMKLIDDKFDHTCRLFEYGCFKGFTMENLDHLKRQLEAESMSLVHIYNDQDVVNDCARNSIIAQKKGLFHFKFILQKQFLLTIH